MNDHAGPIAGAVVGVLALIGLSVTLLMPSQHRGLAETIEDVLEAEEKATPKERHADVEARLTDIQALIDDPRFPKLPVRLRDGLAGLRTELEAYREYQRRLERVPSLDKVSNDTDLDRWEKDVKAIEIPLAYPTWEHTEAGERQKSFLEESRALRSAVDDLRRAYSKLVDSRDDLFRDPNAAGVPLRARKLLDESRSLPTPDDSLKKIPKSTKLTYAIVFRFPNVKSTYENWARELDRVKRTAALAKP